MVYFSEEQFKDAKDRAESFYKQIVEVYCPYFQEKICFNAKGLEHLKFRKKNHARPKEDQYTRFKIISLAPRIIELSRTLQGILHTKNFESIRSHGRTDTMLKVVSYYEFIAVIDEKRVRVIVKQIEDGQKYFWSVIPFWKMDRLKRQRKMNSGNLEIQ